MNIELIQTTGDSTDFIAEYKHTPTDTTGELHIVENGSVYDVSGTLHTGETINEIAEVTASEEVTPEQIFWLVADILEALLCPECGEPTDPK